MAFIEWELFHDKRRNLTVYEKLMSILLAYNPDEIYWRGRSSTIREETR
jgi:hypothetical protein